MNGLGTPDLAPEPRLWDRTVSRRLLHRWAVSEVLVTGAAPNASGGYQVAVQWPRSHLHYQPDRAGRHDPLLVVETVRQSGVYLGHAYHDVPTDRLFALQEMRFELDPAAEPDATTGPANLLCAVGIEDIRRRGDDVLSYRVPTTLTHLGRVFGTGLGVVRLITPAQQDALRRRARPCATPPGPPPTPIERRSVGMAPGAAVALGSDDEGLCVVVDQAQPVFFDHPLDHVPGMLLVEAARQAVRVEAASPSARVVGGRLTFTRFTELCCPPRVGLRSEPETRTVDVTITQHGDTVAQATLRWYEPEGDRDAREQSHAEPRAQRRRHRDDPTGGRGDRGGDEQRGRGVAAVADRA